MAIVGRAKYKHAPARNFEETRPEGSAKNYFGAPLASSRLFNTKANFNKGDLRLSPIVGSHTPLMLDCKTVAFFEGRSSFKDVDTREA